MKKFIIIFILSLLTTGFSIFYQGTYSTTQGTECCSPNCKNVPSCYENHPESNCDLHPECYGDYPTAGFPFAYLYDNTSVSVVGKLHLVDDHFRFGWVLADFLFYMIIFSLIAIPIQRILKRSS